MSKRAQTAYFVFLEHNRSSTQAELVAAADGEKVSVAVVAKALGEKWRQLSDEEKARYKALATERAQTLAAEAAGEAAAAGPSSSQQGDQDGAEAQPAADGEAEAGDAQPQATAHVHAFGFPLSLIRRIMAFDPEVSRISSDAVKATAKSTELFLELMAGKAYAAARAAKRKNLKFADVEHVVRSDRRLGDMGLREVFATESRFAEARGELGEGKENATDKEASGMQSKAAVEAVEHTRPITDFFKA